MKQIKAHYHMILFTSIIFLSVYVVNWKGTALSPQVDIGFSLLRSAVFTYLSLIVFYAIYRFREMYLYKQEEVDIDILERFSYILRNVKIFFAIVLGLQIVLSIYIGYQSVSEQTDATIAHFFMSEMLDLFMAGSNYIRHHIEIIIRVNNPCIMGICTEDYPIIPYILAIVAFFGFRKMMKIRVTRGLIITIRNILVKLLYFSLQLTSKIIHLLRKLLGKLFRFARKQSLQNGITRPLSILFLDTSIGVIWEELTLADYWIDRFNTFLLPPAPIKATLIQ